MYTEKEIKDFFARMPKRALPCLTECISGWEKNVKKMAEWTKIGIDDYLLYLSGRDRIEELLKNETLSSEDSERLKKSDKFFKEITFEIDKSIISSIRTTNENKKKYWFAFRLLKSHYDEWIIYSVY